MLMVFKTRSRVMDVPFFPPESLPADGGS